jgi:deoxyribonuclease-4
MLLGAHMSISGGLHLAIERGKELGCTTIQIFTKNASQWKAKPITAEQVEQFKNTQKAIGIGPIIAHDSYLINLGSPNEEALKKSRQAFLLEMERVEMLGLPYLVMHPGSHVGSGENAALEAIAESINILQEQTKGYKMKILLETTAGQGNNVGYRFEHLAKIIDLVKDKDRLGVCYDTSHIFAAGYDIRTRKAYEKTFAEFDGIIGLDRLLVFHVNDSRKGLGSKVDRHWHIGEGEIGLEAFRLLLNDPRFSQLPFILETPKDKEGKWDKKNLSILKKLIS